MRLCTGILQGNCQEGWKLPVKISLALLPGLTHVLVLLLEALLPGLTHVLVLLFEALLPGLTHVLVLLFEAWEHSSMLMCLGI